MKQAIFYNTTNGELFKDNFIPEETISPRLACLWVTIPVGKILQGVNITDINNPTPILVDLPKTESQKANEQVSALNEYLLDMQFDLCNQKLGL
ncbi:MAG: hypothetical protein ACERKN_07035 [Velocimicrobium sp.]